MDRTRISYKNIKELALPITYRLHLNGWEEFSVDVVLASESSGGLNPDMTSIYRTHTLGEYGTVGKIFKAKANLIKILCIWQQYNLLAHNLRTSLWFLCEPACKQRILASERSGPPHCMTDHVLASTQLSVRLCGVPSHVLHLVAASLSKLT